MLSWSGPTGIAGYIVLASLASLHVAIWAMLLAGRDYDRQRNAATMLLKLGAATSLGTIVLLTVMGIATGSAPSIPLLQAAFAGLFMLAPTAGVFFLSDALHHWRGGRQEESSES